MGLIKMEQKSNNHSLYYYDKLRYNNQIGFYEKLFLYFFRKSSESKKSIFKIIYKLICFIHGIEISHKVQIGKDLYIGHPFNITINRLVKIGENCNIHKGVTIGQENRGKRKGAPTIGNRVWIGINSVIVGNIKIGDDVLIAPNSYVNKDVPSHSIVLGNPCIIKHRQNATEAYINNIV